MTLAYAVALAEARSCLAALADSAPTFDESVHYEHLLLDLDSLHPFGPGLFPTTGTKAGLLIRLEAAVDRMLDLDLTLIRPTGVEVARGCDLR